MNPTLLNEVKITKVKATQSSAGTAVNTDAVDMQGWDGVLFIGALATVNAGNSVNLAQSDTEGGSYADLAGTAVVPGTDGDEVQIDLYQPTKRWVRAEVDRSGANTVTETFYAIQYRGRKAPVTANGIAETHVSPAEGTA